MPLSSPSCSTRVHRLETRTMPQTRPTSLGFRVSPSACCLARCVSPLHTHALSHQSLQLRGAISEWSSGHWQSESFLRKIYYSLFLDDLKTFRQWQKYTSNPVVLEGHGPVRTIPPSFLARTLQESIIEKARYTNSVTFHACINIMQVSAVQKYRRSYPFQRPPRYFRLRC